MSGGSAALYTFVGYIMAVFVLAWAANRLLKERSFLSEYFLGSRSLGVWAFALTFAATSASGGSFTGFPSKIYSHGWVLALWIGSYMVVPICMMGLIGKRINQVARISGAITVPDVLRDRFQSPAFGLMATALIVFFMAFNLVAQCKAGSLILKTLLEGVDTFQQLALSLGAVVGDSGYCAGVDPQYLLCLMVFGLVVVVYTAYGGFHAVVWTDVMQGVVMVVGVVIMLPLALYQVGGLEKATKDMAQMLPPERGTATLRTADGAYVVPAGAWLQTEGRVLRTAAAAVIPAAGAVEGVAVLEIATPHEVERLLGESGRFAEHAIVQVEDIATVPHAYGSDAPGSYVSGPGPSRGAADGFLPLSLAVSFFFMWAIAGTGQPSNFVRLMAFDSARTLRFSIATVAVHYSLIYFPLIIIFCCARILLPGMEAESDRIMPAMVVFLTDNAGVAWLGGLLVAAPFAAVMSTVDSFLLMISSALVRDVYQRNVRPEVSEEKLRKLSYLCTVCIGVGAVVASVNPPQFLQDIIVYTGSGLAACFLGPVVFALYWPRATAGGCMVGMAGGFLVHLSLYAAGSVVNGSFFVPVRVLNMDPILWGLGASFVATYVGCLVTGEPEEGLVRTYFYAE
jgi:sodium/pantothenate symporter